MAAGLKETAAVTEAVRTVGTTEAEAPVAPAAPGLATAAAARGTGRK